MNAYISPTMKTCIPRPNTWASFSQLTVLGLATLCTQTTVLCQTNVNLAVVATPSASYVSGDTSLGALNDESVPRSSHDNRRGSYGNWNRTGTQWVQYE